MKAYQVYAVGTAIVDYEFQIPAGIAFPAEIERGSTVLIDGQQERALLKSLGALTPFKSCGGTSANTLSVISGLGGRVFTSCQVAADEAGKLFHQSLRSQSIESNLDQGNRPAGDTGRCLILIDADGERSIFTQFGVNRSLSETDLYPQALGSSSYLFIETFLATSPGSKAVALAAIQQAKKMNCKIALTLSTCKIPGFATEHVKDFAGNGLDLLFCNALEARYFCGTADLKAITAKLKTWAKQFVITRGEKDTLLFDGRNFIEIPTYPTKAVNTTGAGDAFAGAFLYGLTQELPFATAGKLGNFAAAQVVGKAGARLGPAELQRVRDFIRHYV
jgi:sugar/nucleoside kinase (ribokinase family)